MRHAERARSAALAAVVVALCALGGEWVLRLAGVGPGSERIGIDERDLALEDPELGWVSRPGTAHSTEEGHLEIGIWPDGQRASGPAPGRTAARSAWLFGCSFTLGFGVRDHETYAWGLNARFPDVRFENHAVAGYGTVQSLRLLERRLRERGSAPDLVVYGFIGDHGRRNVASLKWVKSLVISHGLYLVPPRVELDGDGLVFHPLGRIDPWPLERGSAWVAAAHDLWLRAPFAGRGDDKVEASNRLVEQMAERVREAGSRYLVALLHKVPPEMPPFLDAAGIDHVDCTNPAYEDDPRFKVGGVGHPSALQHALWTDCLARALAARGWVELHGPVSSEAATP
jgi:hypothetical protein